MAIAFDTIDDRVTTTNSSYLAPYNSAWTFSAWVYPTVDDVNGGGDPRLFQKGSVYVAFEVTRRWYVQVEGTTGLDTHAAIGSEFAYNTWQHFLVTSDGSTTAANYHLYLNNVEPSYTGATNGSGLTNNLAEILYIGNVSSYSRPLGGKMTEVAFYNSVLSASDRAKLYAGGYPLKGVPLRISTPPVLYLPMNDGTPTTSADGDTVGDLSGSGNNGTGDDGANNTGLTWDTDPANLVNWQYSYTSSSILPTTDAALASSYGSLQKTYVDTEDSNRVATAGIYYLLHQFQNKHTNNTDPFSFTWIGQSSLATSSRTVYLQVYNRTTPGWETIDFDNSTGAGTAFTLSASVSATVGQYYNTMYLISGRVYQYNN